jgi:hypothetical protein
MNWLLIPFIILIGIVFFSKPRTWRARLKSYTCMFMIFGIWMPILWFIYSSMENYKMGTFEVFEMPWFSILGFFVLIAATLVAQVGFILLIDDLSEYEKMKKENSAHQYSEPTDV